MDAALALALLVGSVSISLVAATAGWQAVYVLLLVLALAARGLVGLRLDSRARERLDAALIVGFAGFTILVAERIRGLLNP